MWRARLRNVNQYLKEPAGRTNDVRRRAFFVRGAERQDAEDGVLRDRRKKKPRITLIYTDKKEEIGLRNFLNLNLSLDLSPSLNPFRGDYD